MTCGREMHCTASRSPTKTYLFAFLDGYSLLLAGQRWGYPEDTMRLAAALRPALASRGVPQGVYVDNGSAYFDRRLLRACAKLVVQLVYSTPRHHDTTKAGVESNGSSALCVSSPWWRSPARPTLPVGTMSPIWPS